MADTLMYFKKLEAAGFNRKQAEEQVEMMREFSTEKFFTKSDAETLTQMMERKFTAVDRQFAAVDKQFAAVEARFVAVDARFDRLEIEIARMSDRITIRLGGMMILGFGAMAALIKLT